MNGVSPQFSFPILKTFVALFRGINVGGNNPLPMKSLVALLEDLGGTQVKTYIQSGNAVFRSPETKAAKLAGMIASEVLKRHDFEPSVLLIEPTFLDRILTGNPFPEAASDPAKLHVGFLAAQPEHPDLAKLDRLRAASERYHLGDGVFYMHLPDGAGRSKLAAGAEKALGVPMTARNWNTVLKLVELAGIKGAKK